MSANNKTPSGEFKLLMKKRKAKIELSPSERHNLMKHLNMMAMDESLSTGCQVAAKILLASIISSRAPKELKA